MASFLKVALVLSVVVMMSIAAAESRIVGIGFGNGKEDSTVACSTIHGTESDETCSSVAAAFSLSLDEFLGINPNINCDSIFVGQWLCISGTPA